MKLSEESIGAQEPRIKIEPKRVYTDGDNAAELMASYAFKLDLWQKNILDCWLGRDKNGKLSAMSCGLSMPRQNGKNAVVEAFEFTLLLNVEKTHILHTAHQVKTSKRAFRRLVRIFENKKYPELIEQVKVIRRTNGEEKIELVNGNTIEYSARSKSSARGFDAISVVIYDEAQELTEDQVEAIMSTLAASSTGDRQIIYTGTPPGPNILGDIFKRRRDAALNNPSKRTAWHEWSVEELPIAQKYEDVRQLVYQTNPAMGVRLSNEFTEEQFLTMDAAGFARECLGWWSKVEGAHIALPTRKWDACKTEDGSNPPTNAKRGFGVKFSPDGSEVAVALALDNEDCPTWIELALIEPMDKGMQSLSEWLIKQADTCSIVVIDGKNGAQTLKERLAPYFSYKALLVTNTSQYQTAVQTMLACVCEGSLEWFSPDGNLSDSAHTSTRRAIGTGGGWGFGGEDSIPIEAASLALWGVLNTKRDQRIIQEVW